MYGSYGSYSSMSATSAPVYTTSGNLRSRDASCAFPSWPRRSSLSHQDLDSPRATSFLSDDDLYLCDHPSSDDDSHSISSSSSNSGSSLGSASPPTTALALESPGRAAPSEAEILGMQRERANMRKELMKMVMQEKERRRAARQQQCRSKSSPKKSSCKSVRGVMAPISEE